SCCRTGVRLDRTGGIARCLGRQPPRSSENDRMGNGSSPCRFHPRHAPHCRRFSVEFPLAPTLPSRPRSLCRRSPHIILAKTTTFCRLSPPLAHTPTLDHWHRRKNWQRESLPPHLDLPRSCAHLADHRIDRTSPGSRMDTDSDHLHRASHQLLLHSNELRRSKV